MFRIVIADPDELSTRRLGSALSAVPGLDVVGTASDSERAVEVVRRTLPDVVLLDMTLPPLGGPALISDIRRALPGTRVLVIVEDVEEATLQRAVSVGAAGFLVRETPTDQTPTGLRLLIPDDDDDRGPPSRVPLTGGTQDHRRFASAHSPRLRRPRHRE